MGRKQESQKQNNAKREYSLSLSRSCPIPSSTAGGVAENVAALAWEDRYHRCFPMWQWERKECRCWEGGWGMKNARNRAREVKNASCGKDGELGVWGSRRGQS